MLSVQTTFTKILKCTRNNHSMNVYIKRLSYNVANMKDHACVITRGHHTDIALKIYSNRILLIITHFKKFGSLIAISRGSLFNQYNNSIYSTKVLFGKDDVEVVAAARYIAEQINLDKPLLISISLKDYEPDTLKTIITAINDMKA